ncbi:MAG: c-type cytochrome [Pseudomonadota bacterium]
MKKIIIMSLLVASGAVFADGKKVLEQVCMTCHVVDGQGGGQRAAPPMYAVWHHYRQAHTDKESFVAAVSSWLQQPQKEKSVMKGAVKKFGLMDKLEIDAVQAQSVAEHLYERSFNLPESYLAHYNAKHGKKSHGYDGDEKAVQQDQQQH